MSFKDRLIQERNELRDRCSKLHAFTISDEFWNLEEHVRMWMLEQKKVMNKYLKILNKRIDYINKEITNV